ncbi:GTP-binding protein, partial [Clostridium perfringens]|uniref:GTP-binding protein n=1 Tax=Clostridium perfringens TaxID=1502 RepID=UPI002ACEFF31
GIQGHTETIWNLLRKYNIPTFFFINKMDRTGSELERVIEEINDNLTIDVCYVKSIHEMSEELIEFISERDEELLEQYLDGNYDKTIWIKEFKKLIKENKVFPCLSGSALQDEGIEEFLSIFNELTYTNY